MSSPDLIKRCDNCNYCVFEDMLTIDQRTRKVLDMPIPESHIHRETIEQACGQQYEGVCEMKYAVERLVCNDRAAAQNVCVAMYRFDLGKKYGRIVEFPESFKEWGKKQDFGKGLLESRASRYEDVWNVGLRNGTFDEKGNRKVRQSLTVLNIYEIVVSTPETYEMILEANKRLLEEHKKRDSRKLLVV